MMKKMNLLVAIAIFSLISCGENKENQGETPENKSVITIQKSNNMKTYEDQKLKFEHPDNWRVDVFEVDGRPNYTLIAPTSNPDRNFTFYFNLEGENHYMSGMNKEQLETIFKEEPTMHSHTMEQSELIQIKSGQSALYVVQKSKEKKPFDYSVSLYLPVGDQEASYSLMAGYNKAEEKIFLSVNDTLLEVLKSIEIKKTHYGYDKRSKFLF